MAVSGNTVVMGALGDAGNGFNSGAAYVFVEPVGGWAGNLTETAKLTASDGMEWDRFGANVAVSGDTVVVSADGDALDGTSHAAYVFVEPVGGWAGNLPQTAKLTASDAADDDGFGIAVAVSGDTVVVGAWFDDDNGSAYVFVEPVGGWAGNLPQTAKLTASDGAAGDGDLFGLSVAVSGDTVVVGAPLDDPFSSAYVFVEPAEGWAGNLTEAAKLTASDGAALGPVAVSGGTAVLGAPSFFAPGAAYVFQVGPTMDIKPGSFPNSINVRGNGNSSGGEIPVAILSTFYFDASSVDPSTVAFGPDGAGITHVAGHIVDVNNDGFQDLVLHFGRAETGIACGDADATLTGSTFGGNPIELRDSVRPVPCK